MHQILLKVPEAHRNISGPLGRCGQDPWVEHQCPIPGQVDQIHGGSGEVNISASIRAHAPQLFWRFLRHNGTFLDHLRDVDTPMGRVLTPKNQTKLSKYMGEGEVNISASIRAPCTKFFWEVPEIHRNILDH